MNIIALGVWYKREYVILKINIKQIWICSCVGEKDNHSRKIGKQKLNAGKWLDHKDKVWNEMTTMLI